MLALSVCFIAMLRMSLVLRTYVYAFSLILDALMDSFRATILLKKGSFIQSSAHTGMRMV